MDTEKRRNVLQMVQYILMMAIVTVALIEASMFRADSRVGKAEKPVINWEVAKRINRSKAFVNRGNHVAFDGADINAGESISIGTVMEAPGAGYVLAASSTRKLTREDIQELTAEQLRIACNEILARHGVLFQEEDLKAYFESKSWYKGTIDATDFNAQADALLNPAEKSNMELLQSAR